jgi:hypothetical protein
LKSNFKKNEDETVNNETVNNETVEVVKKDLTQEEFEEYIAKSGAKGSFMVYRSTEKEEELGLDEL